MSDDWQPRDAVLPPAPDRTEHEVEIRVTETELEVAPGVRQSVWTFGGDVPGPVLRGKVGDVFTVTFVNDGTMGHGIDFHASSLAPDEPMRTINPGERLTYRFRAEKAGAWVYHCSTSPMLQHIGNGMYGAVIIDPPDLEPVDREYLLVQGELYLGEPGSADQVARMRAGEPDAWVFNGVAAGYAHAPLTAEVGERVRIWVVAAGPTSGTSFHIVGAQFDTVYKEGAYLVRRGDAGARKRSTWRSPKAVLSKQCSPKRAPIPLSTMACGMPRTGPAASSRSRSETVLTIWTVVRFLHVLGAALWVGGQLTVSLVVLPLARRSLDDERRATLLTAVGRRFGILTAAFFLPLQIGTGVALAWRKGVTWESLLLPGYGQILTAKLVLFALVMVAAALHGEASSRGYPVFARVMAITSVVASVGVIALAAALPAT